VHPIEGIGNAIFHILPVFLMPHHPLAILISTQLKGLVGIWSHLGYEIFPSGFSRHCPAAILVPPALPPRHPPKHIMLFDFD
jgi:sterol desaturase/sphingolipid hydroxylase (fatty acid hydroxylase superfamily)